MREPAFWWSGGAAGALLSPLGELYGAVAAVRMRRNGARSTIPVICAGNFTLGGSGKTPTAIAMAQLLKANGENPFFLTRGYGGSQRGPVEVANDASAAGVGDEALLLSRIAPTIVAADRPKGAALAAERGATVIVMDDGLQNPSLRKNLAVAVIDGPRGIGNGRVFPAGPLRAPIAAQLERVQALLVIGDAAGAHSVISAAMGRKLPIHYGRLIADPVAVSELRDRKFLAFAGIGNPAKFFATLEQEGIEIAARMPFPDHHRYSAADAGALLSQARAQDLQLVTTEKDRARMSGEPALQSLAAQTKVLPVTLALDDEKAFGNFLRAGLRH
jgi:tetraacyldisaccharide 4'-kinase